MEEYLRTDGDGQGPYTCKLNGNAMDDTVDLSGLSCFLPLSFKNVFESTRLREIDTADSGSGQPILGTRVKSILKKSTISLSELNIKKPRDHRPLSPIVLHVAAKRKIDVIVTKEQNVLLLAKLVVADASGYSLLVTFNQGVQTLYRDVREGDVILLHTVTVGDSRMPDFLSLFKQESAFNMELKVNWLKVKDYFVKRCSLRSLAEFKLPLCLFESDPSSRLRLPKDLFATPKEITQKEKYYFDLVGVLSYVGRLQRFQVSAPQVVNGTQRDYKFQLPRMTLYRWIKITDATMCPIAVKLFMSDEILRDQEALVPGTVIVVTNCLFMKDAFTGCWYVAGSDFTSVNVTDENIVKYFAIRPIEFTEKAEPILKMESFKKIITDARFRASCGGTHSLLIAGGYDSAVRAACQNSLRINCPLIVQLSLLKSRQSQFAYFVGKIMKVTTFTSTSKEDIYVSEEYDGMSNEVQNGKINQLRGPEALRLLNGFETSVSSDYLQCLQYDFEIYSKDLDGKSTLSIVQNIRQKFADTCKSLLLHSTDKKEYYEFVKPALNGKCKLDILDSQNGVLLTLIWSRNEKWDLFMRGCNNQRELIFLLELCKIRNNLYDIVLHDFSFKSSQEQGEASCEAEEEAVLKLICEDSELAKHLS